MPTAKEIIAQMFKNKLQEDYRELLDSLSIPSGDIAPEHAFRMSDLEEELANLVADWLLSNVEDPDDGDYAHCEGCDKIINKDTETFVVWEDDTYCAQCAVKEKL